MLNLFRSFVIFFALAVVAVVAIAGQFDEGDENRPGDENTVVLISKDSHRLECPVCSKDNRYEKHDQYLFPTSVPWELLYRNRPDYQEVLNSGDMDISLDR